ncbi:MAG: helix-turn-helix transcriptional regulator [Dehalococcoidia bacterium]|nr:helix-turn-helix transcriptional regulator [Dehalococcoidia bacterium]
MSEVQDRITELQEKGWTLAALADELGVTVNAVQKWKAGDRNPSNDKAVLVLLGQLAKRKRIPKKRRYTAASRPQSYIRVSRLAGIVSSTKRRA